MLVLLLGACASFPKAPSKPPIEKDNYAYAKEKIAWLIKKNMQEQDLQGLTVALVADGKIIWTEGFGKANKQDLVTTETFFRAGSITKTLNALAVMRLAEEGKLNLDENIHNLLPELHLSLLNADYSENDSVEISLRSLLSHQSGVPSDWIYGLWTHQPQPFYSAIPYLNSTYLTHAPDTRFVYSNIAHNIVAKAIERASNTDYHIYMHRMLKDMGITDARISANPDDPATAQGYVKTKAHNELGLRDTPAAGLSIHTQDFAVLLQQLVSLGNEERPLKESILSSARYLEMLADVSSHRPLNLEKRIALGLFYYDGIFQRRVPILGHSGAAVNHRSLMKFAPHHGFGIAVMSNTRNAGNALHTIVDQALPLLYEAQYGQKAPLLHPYWPHPNTIQPNPERVDYVKAEDLIGDYTTIAGLARIYKKDEILKVTIAGKTLNLYQRKTGGYYYPRYKLFGMFNINLGYIGNLGLAVRYINNEKHLISIDTRGQRQMLGEAISPSPISNAWKERIGKYRVATPLDVIDLPSGGLKVVDNYLVAYAKTDRGENMQVVLHTIDDKRAIVLGHGRGLGELVFVEEVNGKEQLRYSGIFFKKETTLRPASKR